MKIKHSCSEGDTKNKKIKKKGVRHIYSKFNKIDLLVLERIRNIVYVFIIIFNVTKLHEKISSSY